MYTEKELTELEQYFKTITLPAEIRLTQCEFVANVPRFINAEFATCRANMGVKTFEAAYDRLVKLKGLLQNEKPGT